MPWCEGWDLHTVLRLSLYLPSSMEVQGRIWIVVLRDILRRFTRRSCLPTVAFT